MTTSTPTSTPTSPAAGNQLERADLLQSLAIHRDFLRHTVRGLTDDQARLRSTVSELTLGGIVKHVTAAEAQWARFVVEGPTAFAGEDGMASWAASFRMEPHETVSSVLDGYAAVAAKTDELVRTVDLDGAHPLPDAPWFPPGARWTARRVLLHLIAETAQHAGHADILRESIDGAKTMG